MKNETLEEIVMLLSLYIKRDKPQTTLVQELNEVGFSPKRIAELIGTTRNAVSVTLNQIKNKKRK